MPPATQFFTICYHDERRVAPIIPFDSSKMVIYCPAKGLSEDVALGHHSDRFCYAGI